MILAVFIFSGVCVIAHFILLSSTLIANQEERPTIEAEGENYWKEIYL